MVLLPYKCMAKIKEREIAQGLRKQGTSIADIATKLRVSKSTVSSWCRDIVLSEDAIRQIVLQSKSKSTKSILLYTEKLRLKRQNDVQYSMSEGAKLVASLTDRDVFCIGLGLYWGEGYKQGNQEFGFTNSDAGMIRFYIKWLAVTFRIGNNDLILRVSINEAHRNRVNEVEEYWAKITGVPLSQFTRVSLVKVTSKKVYANRDTHFGTLRIKVRRGTQKRRIVLGSLESLRTQ